MSEPPLEPLEPTGRWDSPVIDFAGYKARIGRTPYREKLCKHKSVLYSPSERRIWCNDCNSGVEPFDAFITIAEHFVEIARESRADRRRASDALSAVITRRAAKELDSTWGRGMAPCCPHCRRGLLPHDFANGAAAAMSKEIEIARREKDSHK